MMKLKIALIIIVIMHGCKVPESTSGQIEKETISARLKIKKRKTCNDACYLAELHIINNTAKKYYIMPPFILNTYNWLNFDITNRAVKLLNRYNRKHRISYIKYLPKRNECESSKKGVLDEIMNKASDMELNRIYEHNDLDSMNKKDKKRIKAWTKIEYSTIYLLEPFDSCKVNYGIVDTLIKRNKLYKLNYFMNKHEDREGSIKMTLLNGEIIQIPVGSFKTILGYELYTDEIRSNTVIIKGNKFINN